MKNLNKFIVSAFLTAFLMTSQSAMALDEAQEVIPAPSSYMTKPHEHKIGNSENADDPANDKTKAAANDDDHHDKKSMDDTNK